MLQHRNRIFPRNGTQKARKDSLKLLLRLDLFHGKQMLLMVLPAQAVDHLTVQKALGYGNDRLCQRIQARRSDFCLFAVSSLQ